MKTKHLLLGVGIVVVAGGLWFGRVVWRVRHQIVTLDVRNAPLADVLLSLERQTWTKIRAEKALDARITMHVTDKPLADVLDRIAEQAGARWSRLYAVYDSGAALAKLDSALGGNGMVESAGWTKLAPSASLGEHGLEGGGHAEGGPRLFPPGDLPRGMGDAPGDAPPPGGLGPMAGRRGPMMMRRTLNGPMIIQNGNGQVELWSPEELIIDSALDARLGSDTNQTATAQAAADTAQKVHGKWTTYLAFTKSIMGVGFGVPPRGRPGFGPLRANPNDRFARLTPQQRVERERQRLGLNIK